MISDLFLQTNILFITFNIIVSYTGYVNDSMSF